MPNPFSNTTLKSTYHDDWVDSDNYYQILFNSGKALQARELTQLQTILQDQISNVGQNLFKEGSSVVGGTVSVDGGFRYISTTVAPSNWSVGETLTGTSGVQAVILKISGNETYIRYTNDGLSQGDPVPATTTVFQANEVVTNGSQQYTIGPSQSSDVGIGTLASVEEGTFFVAGRVIHTAPQELLIGGGKSPSVNTTLGFKIIQDVITVNDSQDLYDNSSGLPNISSPGADRYRIRLVLAEESSLAASDTFVKISSIQNSKIVEDISNSMYNRINDYMALRTFEESGNYISDPFTVHYEENNDGNGTIDAIISSGTAYVNGYRVHNPAPVRIAVPKPVATENVIGEGVTVGYGSYVIVDAASNDLLPLSTSRGTILRVELHDNASASSKIGEANLVSVEDFGTQAKAYLADIDMNSNQKFGDVLTIKDASSGDYLTLTVGAAGTANENKVRLLDAGQTNYLFKFPRPRPGTVVNHTFDYYKNTGDRTASGNSITVPTSVTEVGETLVEDEDWVIMGPNGVESTSSVTIVNNGTDATISGLSSATGTYQVGVRVRRSNATRKTKTLQTTSVSGVAPVTSGGITSVSLGQYDIYEILAIKSVNASGADISEDWILDGGQRDTHYERGKIILNSGVSAPVSVYVQFKHFDHGAGDFFDAQSYTGVTYAEIPSHTLATGEKVPLRNVLDFRGQQDPSTQVITGVVPAEGSTITTTVDYYLPRADKIIVTQEGQFQVLMGQQAKYPQFKKTPDNALDLYKVTMNANTLNGTDLRITPIEHKSYTMADIAELEKKLEKLTETTSLSLIELKQQITPALDSDGDVRIESGSVSDNFTDQTGADTQSPDYSASVDPESKLLRPPFDENNIRLIYRPDDGITNQADANYKNTSKNVTRNGDNVYLNYSTSAWKTQAKASWNISEVVDTVKVNKFGKADNIGKLTLSPSSDEWKGTKYDANLALEGSNRIDKKEAFLWNSWEWNWIGRSSEDIDIRDIAPGANTSISVNRKFGAFGRRGLVEEGYYDVNDVNLPTNTTAKGAISRIISNETLRRRAGRRMVDIALIPWIRSRKIYFKAEGLKPNTNYDAFFDNVNVNDWVKGDDTFQRHGDPSNDTDYGNLKDYAAVVSHPDGAVTVRTDANGFAQGSFFIPNIRPAKKFKTTASRGIDEEAGLRFRAGVREFKLIDASSGDYTNSGSKASAFYTVMGSIPTKVRNILSTRSIEYASPLPAASSQKINEIYNVRELQQIADAVSAANVALIEPHPSGSWGAGDAAATLSAYTGNMSQIISDYATINKNLYGSGSTGILPTVRSEIPLGQSFFVDNQFGVVLTSIDTFFKAKGSLPITMQIRPIENGLISNDEIVPGSTVVKNASAVSVPVTPYTSLSDIQGDPTTFTFEEPVYLNPWTEYAICFKTDDKNYELYIAKTGNFEIGSASKQITTTAGVGKLYSGSAGTTVPNENLDLMYTINRAVFDTNGSLILRNAAIPSELLKKNPIRCTSGSATVYVQHPCHGLHPNDVAFLQHENGTNISENGITITAGTGYSVIAIDAGGYTITVGGSATNSTNVGGDDVIAARNIHFDVVNPYIETIIPNNTSIDVSARFTSGRSVSGAETKYVKETTYSRIVPKINTTFSSTKVLAMRTEETNSNSNPNNGASILNTSGYSADIKVDFKSSNDYVSPIVDLQRCSLVIVVNCIDDPALTPYINEIPETDPHAGSSPAKHITTPVTVAEDAVGLQITFEGSIPPEAGVDTYYRTALTGQNILDQQWIKVEPEALVANNNNGSEFSSYEFLPGGKSGTLPGFNQAQLKTVMKSIDTTKIPKIRDLNLRFLAV